MNERAFRVTSVTNARRKLMNERIKNSEVKIEEDGKKRAIHPSHLQLKVHQQVIEDAMAKDHRNIKKKNPRKSVLSEVKWIESGRWAEIIAEAMENIKKDSDKDKTENRK